MYNALLIIDPQNDFCKAPAKYDTGDGTVFVRGGSLYVPGAEKDMERLAEFILNNMLELNDIYITFDDHKRIDIAHQMWWSDGKGDQPDPFTVITYKDIKDGKWFARIPDMQSWTEFYLRTLEMQGNYPHVIWPYHCIAGTEGAAMVPILDDAISEWSLHRCSYPEIIRKGQNMLTEHYSAVKAEVETKDKDTQVNENLVAELRLFDTVYVAGEAFSHCLANTVRDLVRYGVDPKNIVILKDCTSNVPTFEELGAAFQREMESINVRFINSVDING